MSSLIKPERENQQRVVALFRDALNYRYLGNRSDRLNNSNIVEELTLHGNHERRPDLVLYVNGTAVAVIELKKRHLSGDHCPSRILMPSQQIQLGEMSVDVARKDIKNDHLSVHPREIRRCFRA